VSVSVPIDSL